MDLICAIATPAAQSIANATKDIPILGTAITDYVGAKLAASNDKPGANVSGTSDMNPIKEQVDLLMKLCPNAKTIGVIYCSSEVNSEVQVKAMTEYAASKGLTVKTATISTVNDIQQAAQSLNTKVDAFYAPTDNVLASAMPTLISIPTRRRSRSSAVRKIWSRLAASLPTASTTINSVSRPATWARTSSTARKSPPICRSRPQRI